ncbi:MAG: DUF4292 domain-containing protein [Bacteroidota bacterium]
MSKRLFFAIAIAVTLSACNKKIGAVFSRKDKLEIINPDFKYLTSKAKFKFDDKGKRVSANANFRISKDSVIWISISTFGFEGARVLIDTSLVRVLDRLNKKYYEYSFEELSEQYNFDFSFKMVQSVLLGNLIAPYSNEKYKKTDEYYSYHYLKGAYDFQNFIGNRSMKLEKVKVQSLASSNSISVKYSDFIRVKDQIFPNEIAAQIDYASDKPNTKINISYSKMEIESIPLRFPYSVSGKYERK